MSTSSLVSLAEKEFIVRFGRRPSVFVAAPGRVNLIGEHTDYNDGPVFPLAIDRHTVIAADIVPGSRTAVFHSASFGESVTLALDERATPAKDGVWHNYVRGVVAGMHEAGFDAPGFEAVAVADIPLGGGLSSSASLEVVVATLFEALCGRQLEPEAKALLCQRAEHDYAGVPCGIMDQFVSVMASEGHALLLDCRDRSTRHVPISNEVSILIANSGIRHELAAGEYAKRREQCEVGVTKLGVASLRELDPASLDLRSLDETVSRRVRHVVSEIDRTFLAAEALKACDWSAFGDLMRRSHESLRADYEVTCPEVDLLVEQATRLEGVFGARMTGGGFGGSIVALVASEYAGEASQRLDRAYQEKTRMDPGCFTTRPMGGAKVL